MSLSRKILIYKKIVIGNKSFSCYTEENFLFSANWLGVAVQIEIA